MCVSLAACKSDADGGGCTPLMYKVSDGKGATLYLLGSIHIGDKRTRNMPDYVMDAYSSSSYLCVEANIVAYEKDLEAQMRDLKTMECAKGKSIKEYLPVTPFSSNARASIRSDAATR